MQRRTLFLLGGGAVLTVGGALLLTPSALHDEVAPSAANLAFPGLAARLTEAARIEIRKHDGSLTLLRQDEAWVLPERGNYPVRPERVRELLVGLTELRLVEARTADPGQHDRLGVDDPNRPGSTALLLRVLAAGGQPIAELVIGRRRVRTQGNVPESAYIRRPSESQAWLAEGRLPADADPQLWVDRDIANIAQDRIRRVTIRREGEPELVLARGEGPEAKLRLEQPVDPRPLDDVSLDEVARGFEYLTFLEVKPAAEAPGRPLGASRFELADGMMVTVLPAHDGETLWIRLEAEGPESASLQARWQAWAYQVGVWKEKAFIPRLEDLLPQAAPSPPPTPGR
ncbi:DUF4340 domain-containing protein [Belnapia rosea]|uniref:DUF4340 domain-containing protein n=1 Tax=Belnapia rosea TaxID=938405 RepID=A0A1G6KWJ2_9PROT|nr:DUF4340 domain-containing protein [Belnapia rosea]SDB70740.1 protein of unknown function [Belnapia rosea]SDC35327.1 protein of unknown function [Belnapia rosea]